MTQYRVQVVRHQPEPRVFNASIHRVIVAPAVIQPTLAVARQRINSYVSHPLLDVNDLTDLFYELGIRDAVVVEYVRKVAQIRPVIVGLVSLLEIHIAVGVGIITSVIQLGSSLALVGAAVQVAGAVIGEIVVGPVAVEYIQSHIRTVHMGWVVQS
ncbi:hypothetical protein ES707_22908 [subsurface metagenome]